MDQYFVKILANIVTIDQQPPVSRDPRENRELAILCLELSQSSVSPRPLVNSCKVIRVKASRDISTVWSVTLVLGLLL